MDQTSASARPSFDDRRGAARLHFGDHLLLRMLDEMQYGMVLLDCEARIGYSNALGRDEICGNGPLQLRDGVVTCTDRARSAAFREALVDALRGRRRLLTFATGAADTSIAITPMLDGDDYGAQQWAAHALLIFAKRPEIKNLSIDFFARAHKLTSAESQVLVHLAHGLDPAGIADRQCVAISTVRSQIASIRAKTCTTSIRQLLDRVAMLPPIRTVVRTAARHPAEAVD